MNFELLSLNIELLLLNIELLLLNIELLLLNIELLLLNIELLLLNIELLLLNIELLSLNIELLLLNIELLLLNIATNGVPYSVVILSFIICRVPMSIDVVLATFEDNLLPCNHTLRFSNSVFMVLVMSLTSIAECARIVSPACIVTLEHFNAHNIKEEQDRANARSLRDSTGNIFNFGCYSIYSTALLPILQIGREPFVLSILNSIVAEFSE